MNGSGVSTVFFDLGDTLGVASLTGDPPAFTRFTPFEFSRRLLASLAERTPPLRLGIISNTGNFPGSTLDALLADAGLLQYFDSALRIYSKDVGRTKNSPEIFRLAAMRAGEQAHPAHCLFVGEDASERMFALRAGMRVAPHPLLVKDVLSGHALRYLQIRAPRDIAQAVLAELRRQPIVALRVSAGLDQEVLAIGSQETGVRLLNMFGAHVRLLGEIDAPNRTNAYLLRDDTAVATGFGDARGEATRFFSEGADIQMLLASTPDGLLVALPGDRSPDEFHFENARHGHTVKLMPDPLLLAQSNLEIKSAGTYLNDRSFGEAIPTAVATGLQSISASRIRDRVERYSGLRPVEAGGPLIDSRHIAHPANRVVVEAVAGEFNAIGRGRLQVRLVPFTHLGQVLFNVEAELPGTTTDLVLVTAHLDSTAAGEHSYNSRDDRAPGADDDASGVAAVLSSAQWFAEEILQPLEATVRFVLFNAEEHGLIGSHAYAREQRHLDARIRAVLQMDMIGYNREPPRDWEVHCGFLGNADVERRSVELGSLIRSVIADVAPELPSPRVFHCALMRGDPAADRSDHAAFHARGYAACAVTEAFFSSEDNPNYHRFGDTFVDFTYAADISRVVAAAAWLLAGGQVQRPVT